jgi:gentisate 1,2-dioxygenase
MTNHAADPHALDHLTAPARFHDYRYASNPLAEGSTGEVPLARFDAELHEHGGTRVLALDNSVALGCPGPATSPGLCANFVRVRAGEGIVTDANASSHLFFVMRGAGTSTNVDGDPGLPAIPWKAGDLFTLPARSRMLHAATDDAALYWVCDAPLLGWLAWLACLLAGVLPGGCDT